MCVTIKRKTRGNSDTEHRIRLTQHAHNSRAPRLTLRAPPLPPPFTSAIPSRFSFSGYRLIDSVRITYATTRLTRDSIIDRVDDYDDDHGDDHDDAPGDFGFEGATCDR